MVVFLMRNLNFLEILYRHDKFPGTIRRRLGFGFGFTVALVLDAPVDDVVRFYAVEGNA